MSHNDSQPNRKKECISDAPSGYKRCVLMINQDTSAASETYDGDSSLYAAHGLSTYARADIDLSNPAPGNDHDSTNTEMDDRLCRVPINPALYHGHNALAYELSQQLQTILLVISITEEERREAHDNKMDRGSKNMFSASLALHSDRTRT